MGCGRAALIGAAVVASAGLIGCGGGGRSLEAWAEDADVVCADLADELEDADADEAEDAIDEAIAALEELDPPGGDDEAVAEDAIAALEDGLTAQADVVGRVGSGDDAFAELAAAVDGADVDAELDEVDAAGADACTDVLEDGVGDTSDFETAIDLLPDVAALRVGDCVVLDPEVAEAACDAADAEIVQTAIGEPACPDDADITQTFESSSGGGSATLGFCARSLAAPADADNFLEVGSCANVVQEADGDFTVREVPCDAADATHEIVEGTNDPGDCFEDELAFATSDDELAEFGVETWCAAPL